MPWLFHLWVEASFVAGVPSLKKPLRSTARNFQFALEGWPISDLYSFLTAEPATDNIDALDDCELVLISGHGVGVSLCDQFKDHAKKVTNPKIVTSIANVFYGS